MKESTVREGFAIVVLDRGFVYVGKVRVGDGWCRVDEARNIRTWGTKRGLGELALKGPTTETVLDDVGALEAPIHALIHVIDTEEKLWTK